MSFIYNDPNLINKLLKSALDFQIKFTKQGQTSDIATTNNGNLQILLNNLQNTVNSSTISYQGNTVPQYDKSSLDSLGNLAYFLSSNKITVGGEIICYSFNETPEGLKDDERYHYYKLEGANEYFINKDLLIKFIKSRQAKLSTKPNKNEEIQLKSLINKANDLLETNIGLKFDSKALNEDSILDWIQKPITNILMNHIEGDGLIPLKLMDVESKESLNAWLDNNGMTVNVDGSAVDTKNNKFNDCIMIQNLYERANKIRSKKENKDLIIAYKTKINELASSKEYNCKLNGVQQTSSSNTSELDSTVLGKLKNLVNYLPLSNNEINFDKIEGFFALYEEVLNTSSNNVATAATNDITRARQIMQTVKQMTNSSAVIYNLNMDQGDIMRMLKWANANPYIPFLEQLEELATLTGNVLRYLYSSYFSDGRLKISSSEKNALLLQYYGGNSALYQNKSKLGQLMQHIPGKVV